MYAGRLALPGLYGLAVCVDRLVARAGQPGGTCAGWCIVQRLRVATEDPSDRLHEKEVLQGRRFAPMLMIAFIWP
eukprot:1154751-Pelagomonas_calceolata.AAC.1